MSWFHQLPSSTLAILVVTATIVVSVGGLALTAGWVRRTDVHHQLDIGSEWPFHERGISPPGLLGVLERVQDRLFRFEPATEGQKIVHAEILHTYNRMIESRRLRLQAVEETALPGALWTVVVLLGVIAISTCYMLRLDNFRLHAIVTTLVAAPIALILYFIAVTDRPFQGGVNVSPKPYRVVLEEIMLPDLSQRR